MAGKVEIAVKQLIEETVNQLGFDLADVEFKREKDGMYLKIYIYSKDRIGIDDCVKVHRATEDMIESEIDIEGPYIMEVSSPGYDRKFKNEADFIRYMGETVEVKLYKSVDGKKVFSGSLTGYESGLIKIENENGMMQFNEKEVASVKRKFVN